MTTVIVSENGQSITVTDGDGDSVTVSETVETVVVGDNGTGSGLPAGGEEGDLLVKQSVVDGDALFEVVTAVDVGADPAGAAQTLNDALVDELGTSAYKNVGTSSTDVAAGDAAQLAVDELPTVDTDDHTKAVFDTVDLGAGDYVTYLRMANLASLADIVAGPGVPDGGTTAQVLAKASDADFDDEWVDAGAADLGDAVILAPADSARNVIEPSADATALTLKADPAQTEHVFKVYDLAGDLAVDIDNNGIFDTRRVVVQTPPDTGTDPGATNITPGRVVIHAANDDDSPFQIHASPTNPTPGAVGFRVQNPGDGAVLAFSINDPTDTAWEIGPASGQTAPFAVFWNYAFDTRLLQILADGAVVSNAHTEPADADLDNSSHVTWLDDTPGSTALRVKAKDSAGTVRTATVPLS